MPLNADENLRFKKQSAQLVPSAAGKPPGWVLAVVGGDPGYDWRHPPQAQILYGDGSPDTVVTATRGRPYIDRTDGDTHFWLNDDGETAWHEVGAGGASFPITFDDGTYTYTIDEDGAGNIELRTTLNSGTVDQAQVFIGAGGVNAAFLVVVPSTNNTGLVLSDEGGGGVVLQETDASGSGGVSISDHGSGGINLVSFNSSDILFQTGSVIKLVGKLFFRNNTAAAALGFNSSFTIWLDDTPGATQLNIRAKDSAGTTVNGSIALT